MSIGYLFLEQLNRISEIISDEHINVVTDIAESVISDKVYSVARQVKSYFYTHPELQKEDFAEKPRFMKAAVPKAGDTGYSVWTISTTYNAEFTLPMDYLREKTIKITQTTRWIVSWIITVSAAIGPLTAIIYGNILSLFSKAIEMSANMIDKGASQ